MNIQFDFEKDLKLRILELLAPHSSDIDLLDRAKSVYQWLHEQGQSIEVSKLGGMSFADSFPRFPDQSPILPPPDHIL